MISDLMAKRPGEGRRPLNGRYVMHGVRRDRVEEGASPQPVSPGHELGHLAGALGIAPRDVGLNASASIHFFSPALIQISTVVVHSPRPPPWPRNPRIRIFFGGSGGACGTYCTGDP